MSDKPNGFEHVIKPVLGVLALIGGMGSLVLPLQRDVALLRQELRALQDRHTRDSSLGRDRVVNTREALADEVDALERRLDEFIADDGPTLARIDERVRQLEERIR